MMSEYLSLGLIPTVLPLIEHFLNSFIHSETGLSPFGSSDLSNLYLPISSTSVTTPSFLKQLKSNIWISWNKDIFDIIPNENFGRSHTELYFLIFTLKDSATQISLFSYQIFSYYHCLT